MSTEIVFYDIAPVEPLRTFAPSPWKTRFALNYKGVPYRTEWVDMADIPSVREKLGVPPNRTLPDGTPYNTLPVIHDLSTGEIIGDTFEIALYLDRKYPDRPLLFRPMTAGLTAAFNAYVDALLTKSVSLCTNMPVTERAKAVFVKRHGAKSWDDMKLPEEAREKLMGPFEASMGELAKAYKHTGSTTDHLWREGGTAEAQAQRPPPGHDQPGPFLDGDAPAYADFIVGAWLSMMRASLKPEEWEKMRSWQGGLWEKVLKGLEKWTEMK